MRELTHANKVREFMEAVGRLARGPGRVYLTGGATAVLLGWRETTLDLDLKLDPEPPGIFEVIARLKDELRMNVELAAPDDFIPPLPNWRGRSAPIAKCGQVEFYHYDFCAQALAKVERGHVQDASDVAEMLRSGIVQPEKLRELFALIEPELPRYPAIDPEAFRRKLAAALAGAPGSQRNS